MSCSFLLFLLLLYLGLFLFAVDEDFAPPLSLQYFSIPFQFLLDLFWCLVLEGGLFCCSGLWKQSVEVYLLLVRYSVKCLNLESKCYVYKEEKSENAIILN